MSVPGVRLVVRNFNERGMEALSDKPRSGRPPKATTRYVACLKQAVAKSPRAFGYVFGSWTLDRLREHLGRRCNVLLNPHYLSRLMNKHGIVYRRPRHIMGHLRDPHEYQEKKELLAFLKKTRGMAQPDSNCSTLMSVKFISTRPSPKPGPSEVDAAKSPRPAVIRNAVFTGR
jgi:transposase